MSTRDHVGKHSDDGSPGDRLKRLRAANSGRELEAALAITALANSSPTALTPAFTWSPRLTALGRVKERLKASSASTQAPPTLSTSAQSLLPTLPHTISSPVASQPSSSATPPAPQEDLRKSKPWFFEENQTATDLSVKRVRKRKIKQDADGSDSNPNKPPRKRKPTLRELLGHTKTQRARGQQKASQESEEASVVVQYLPRTASPTTTQPTAVQYHESQDESLDQGAAPAPDLSPPPLMLNPALIRPCGPTSYISSRHSSILELLRTNPRPIQSDSSEDLPKDPPPILPPVKITSVPSSSPIILSCPLEEQTRAIPKRILPDIPKTLPSSSAAADSGAFARSNAKLNLRVKSLSAVEQLYKKASTTTVPSHHRPLATASTGVNGRLQTLPAVTHQLMPGGSALLTPSVSPSIVSISSPGVASPKPQLTQGESPSCQGSRPLQSSPAAGSGERENSSSCKDTPADASIDGNFVHRINMVLLGLKNSDTAEEPTSSPTTPTTSITDHSKLPPKKRRFFTEGASRNSPSSGVSRNSPAQTPPAPSDNRPSSASPSTMTISNPESSGSASSTTPGTARTPMADPGRSLLLLRELHLAIKADEDGDLPLHIAVVQSQERLVEQLIQMMAMMNHDVDRFNKLRQTPLHLAVITKQLAMVSRLLKANASPNLPDRNGFTAVHLAVKHWDADVLKELLSKSKVKVSLNAKNYEGLSPLHVAVEEVKVDAAGILLDSGADVDILDGKSGRTPLFFACENNNIAMAELLIKNHANVNVTNYSGAAPIQIANSRGFAHIVNLLVRHGADNSNSPWPPEAPVKNSTSPSVKKTLKDVIKEKKKDDGTKRPRPKTVRNMDSVDLPKSVSAPQSPIIITMTPDKMASLAAGSLKVASPSAVPNLLLTTHPMSSKKRAATSPVVVITKGSENEATPTSHVMVPNSTSSHAPADVIAAMEAAMKQIGSEHPHFSVLQKKLEELKQSLSAANINARERSISEDSDGRTGPDEEPANSVERSASEEEDPQTEVIDLSKSASSSILPPISDRALLMSPRHRSGRENLHNVLQERFVLKPDSKTTKHVDGVDDT